MVFPSDENCKLITALSFLCTQRSAPVETSHRRIVPSQLADAKYLPSGENARALMGPSCPRKITSSCPVETSHRRIVLSQLADAKDLPSGENARALMGP